MNRTPSHWIAPTVSVLLAGAVALSSRPPSPPIRSPEGPLLPRAGFLHAIFAAQQNLVADYFWILTIHQVGDAHSVEESRDIYAYADRTTDLDPKFARVYSFAGISIPVQTTRDVYANTDESTKLLEKGRRNVPEDFRVSFQLAYNYIFFHKRYKEAADILSELSKRPGTPNWIGSLASRLYAQSGDFDAATEITKQLARTAEDKDTKRWYEERYRQIEQEKILRRIDDATAKYTAEMGHPPDTIKDLADKGMLVGLPPDPFHGQWYLDDQKRARATASKFRLEVIQLHDQEPEKK